MLSLYSPTYIYKILGQEKSVVRKKIYNRAHLKKVGYKVPSQVRRRGNLSLHS